MTNFASMSIPESRLASSYLITRSSLQLVINDLNRCVFTVRTFCFSISGLLVSGYFDSLKGGTSLRRTVCVGHDGIRLRERLTNVHVVKKRNLRIVDIS